TLVQLTCPMILPVHDRIRTHLTDIISSHFGLDRAEVPAIVIEMPPKRALGDLAVPVAFELARRLRKAPRAIAQDLAAALGAIDGIARVEAAPNGYLNFFIDRVAFVTGRMPGAGARAFAHPAERAREKVIVEHTAINPNKAAHIGHLRNSALGDTLVRVLKFRGNPVEVQNYIDDTGVQVADVVVGFQHLEKLTLEDAKRIGSTTRFDYYCWDLYARVTEWYAGDKERLKIRAATLHDIEHGVDPTGSLASFIADTVVHAHLKTMKRLNIDYQLLTWEGDILRLQFWARAFEVLKQTGAVFLQTEGKHAGCWVMKIDAPGGDEDTEAPKDASTEDTDTEDREKVIVRSNGTVVYVGKDMAYQFWKSGLLGKDFLYRPFATRMDGETLWATTSDRSQAVANHPPFGDAAATFNVIDVRQSYLQKLLKQALTAIGHPQEADHLKHFSYEMVALSHDTAQQLGFAPDPNSEEAKKPFVEVSGRKGLGVKADDLIDRVIEKALVEVDKRQSDLPASDRRRVAEQIGVAAVRYFLIKFSRTTVIAFDIDEAVSFVGETGPYIQYAVVRANKILGKLEERFGLDEAATLQGLPSSSPETINEDAELWALVLEASRLDEVVEQVVRSLEFAVLAKFGFGLAQMFSAFYQNPKQSVVNEERAEVRRWRAAAVAYCRQQLTRVLDLMGVAVPARM
ncbi:MAG TPA: arginine--tRNA ligase, partial [Vicinamibacterales bacterium]|nr:arginine--tRNA ligase [Vicinamibacterales bacterium]